MQVVGSKYIDGQNKPFCTKAITIIDNFNKAMSDNDIDKSQFLKAITAIDKLSPINFSDRCGGIFSMCLTMYFFVSHIAKVVF